MFRLPKGTVPATGTLRQMGAKPPGRQPPAPVARTARATASAAQPVIASSLTQQAPSAKKCDRQGRYHYASHFLPGANILSKRLRLQNKRRAALAASATAPESPARTPSVVTLQRTNVARPKSPLSDLPIPQGRAPRHPSIVLASLNPNGLPSISEEDETSPPDLDQQLALNRKAVRQESLSADITRSNSQSPLSLSEATQASVLSILTRPDLARAAEEALAIFEEVMPAAAQPNEASTSASPQTPIAKKTGGFLDWFRNLKIFSGGNASAVLPAQKVPGFWAQICCFFSRKDDAAS
jgi:hypothetical protein